MAGRGDPDPEKLRKLLGLLQRSVEGATGSTAPQAEFGSATERELAAASHRDRVEQRSKVIEKESARHADALLRGEAARKALALKLERERLNKMSTRELLAEARTRGVRAAGITEKDELVQALLDAPPPKKDDSDDDEVSYGMDGLKPGQPEFAPGFGEPDNITRERANFNRVARLPRSEQLQLAEAGDVDAQAALGQLLSAREGMPWLTKAIAGGHALAAIAAACYAVDAKISTLRLRSEAADVRRHRARSQIGAR